MIEPHLQRGLFTALATVAGGRIYDRAPQVEHAEDQVYPYVTFGALLVSARDGSGRNLRGFEVSARLHSWDRSALKVRETQAEIYGALHAQDLGLDEFATVFMTRNDTDVMSDPDGVFHGVCEYVGLFNWTPWLFDADDILRPEGRILANRIL